MKKILLSIMTLLVTLLSCDDYLDVNTNVDSPDWVSAELRLAPMLAQFEATYTDMRMVGPICQYLGGSANLWNLYGSTMYYRPTSDDAQVFRMVYWIWGQNLHDIINQGIKENKPFYTGIALTLKSLGFYMLTSLHGELPLKQFLDPDRTTFDYDSQEYILLQSRSWAKQAIAYLEKEDKTIYPSSLTTYDLMFAGNKDKWKKLAYGVLARNYMTLSNKEGGKYLDSAIWAANNSLASPADDATVIQAGTTTDNSNFFGIKRANLAFSLTQTDYMVDVMTGRVKLYDPNTGSTSSTNNRTDLMTKQYVTDTSTLDPRTICYFGTTTPKESNLGNIDRKTYTFTGTLLSQNVQVSVYGTTATPTVAISGTGRWLFRDDAPTVVMTYAEIQFIKAEAQYRKNDKAGALATFKLAVAASLETTKRYIVSTDKIDAANFDRLASNYLASNYVNGLQETDFELAHIMMQKYVAGYPWNLDTWNDLRRYNYDLKLVAGIPTKGTSWDATNVYHKNDTDVDRVYKGFYLYSANVTNRRSKFITTNEGAPSYRLRPRYNSEYVWNVAALEALQPISGTAANYNTSVMWFALP